MTEQDKFVPWELENGKKFLTGIIQKSGMVTCFIS
jgi:hypothetical protein